MPKALIARRMAARQMAKALVRRVVGADRGPVIAVDLDGTLAVQLGSFDPAVIGPPIAEEIENVRRLQEAGCSIAIFTCRDSDELVAEWLDENSVPWDAINENPSGAVSSRKVFADVYYDNKGANPKDGLASVIKLLPDGEVKRRLLAATPKKHEFGCVMLELPESVSTAIKAMGATIDPAILAGDGVEDWPHLTLLYGIVGMSMNDVVEAVRKIDRVDIILRETTAFENDEKTVLKIDVESPELHRQRARLEGALSFVQTHPTFQPHITIAYLSPERHGDLHGPNELTGKVASITHAVVSMEDGRRVRIPLRKA